MVTRTKKKKTTAAQRAIKRAGVRGLNKGKTSAAYWADKVLWAGKSGKKKSPPKGQRRK